MSRTTSSATEWTCAVCRAHGSIEHAPSAARVTINALMRTTHAVERPKCPGTPDPNAISGSKIARPRPLTLCHREGA